MLKSEAGIGGFICQDTLLLTDRVLVCARSLAHNLMKNSESSTLHLPACLGRLTRTGIRGQAVRNALRGSPFSYPRGGRTFQ
jgi:hypothetical protein